MEETIYADADEKWQSQFAKRNIFPTGSWGILCEDVALIKDTGRGGYKNLLVDPGTFLYALPSNTSGNNGKSIEMVRFFVEQAALGAKDKKPVLLFSAHGADDHLLGTWAVDNVDTRTKKVIFRRLARQDASLFSSFVQTGSKKRSRSEAEHEEEILAFLRAAFPDKDMKILHEPAMSVQLNAPIVVDGEMQDYSNSRYTIDFVAADATGSFRFAIESKHNIVSATDAVAVAKCVSYRDANLCRVLTFADHGGKMQVLDFGPPRLDAAGAEGGVGGPAPAIPYEIFSDPFSFGARFA